MFTLKGDMFFGNCWCPKSDEPRILRALSAGYLKEVQGGFPSNQTPPTYFRLNDFTAPFQSIVDTYGIPNYQEANPAFFSAVTFPFLFGVMFGDVGHGLVLTMFATYLCWAKDSILSSGGLFKAAVPVRYLLLMMGLCATYSGFIYNDFLGIPFNFFGSGWSEQKFEYNQRQLERTYPFGLDPIWYRSKNELIFFNSFKMKISVIFGVIQMIAGNFFKGANAIHFRSKTDFFFEFIPQLVFMSCIFGYMILMILIKWCTSWDYNFNDNAPNLITVLMNMFLKLGKLDDDGRALWGDGKEQEKVQLTLLLIGLLAVPVMLFPKPVILYYSSKKQAHHKKSEDYEEFDKEHHGHDDHGFGEIFIHQMIETIEYVLGAVSNTASYLRLWALSLAHAQLASVFFEKTLVTTIESGNPILVVVGFFMFANVTVGVLMCMDSLECFLHALRLHWVEFMNKFYKGNGIRFAPFSFDEVIKSAEAKKHS
jgi:V-type H+-transporting ATPase subunit a